MQSFIWFILCNNGLDYTGFQLRISTPIVLSAFKTRFTAASASSSVRVRLSARRVRLYAVDVEQRNMFQNVADCATDCLFQFGDRQGILAD